MLTKVHIVKSMVFFSVVMYECESSTKKTEHQRIDAFELWCWRRLLKVLWTSRIYTVNPKENQPWIFIGMTYAEIETLILCPHDVGSWLIRKDPDAGKDLRQEKKTTEDEMVGWHHRWTQRTWVSAISRRWWRTGKPGVLQSMGSQRVGNDWATEQQVSWQQFLEC